MFKFDTMRLMVLFLITLSACNPQRKLYKAIDELQRHPIESAKYCADKYPVKDTTIYRDSVKFDTLYMGEYVFDTTVVKDTVYITKTVPKTITKTVTNIKEVYRENTARTEQYRLQYEKCEAKYQALFLDYEKSVKQGFDYRKQRDKMRLWFWILVGAIGAYTVLKVKKILPF